MLDIFSKADRFPLESGCDDVNRWRKGRPAMSESTQHDEAKGPIVEVENLKTNDSEKFHMPWSATVAEVWAKAYDVFGEARGEGDQFQCADGTNLAPYLGRTLEQLRQERVCSARKFQIRGPTGGAVLAAGGRP